MVIKNFIKTEEDNLKEDDASFLFFEPPIIYGSSTLNNVINICYLDYAINDIVKSALYNSKIELDYWNKLTYFTRDEIIGVQINMMRLAHQNSNNKMDWLKAVETRIMDRSLKEKLTFLFLNAIDKTVDVPKPMKCVIKQ